MVIAGQQPGQFPVRDRTTDRTAAVTCQAARGPLAGLKVVELTHVMAGPTCGLMLADMGADVVKVEKIPGGDDQRRAPPNIGAESATFLMVNRSKRGIALDLKTQGGKRVLRRILGKADVLVENYRHGVLERLGFGYETLARDNPGLIYCSISGFGRTGPYAERGGFDLVAQGMSGLMSITGEAPGRPPVKVGSPVTDIMAGLTAAMGILAALHHRARTGEGQMVDTSLFEAGIVATYWQSAMAFATGIAPGPMGSAHPLNAPYQAFAASDGWITIGAANQANWLRLVQAIGAPHLADDPRYATNATRLEHRLALEDELNAVFRRASRAEWLERLEAAGVPAGPVLDVAEMHENEQALAREMVVETEHSALGVVKTIGLPVKFSKTPGGVRSSAPALGEHTGEVLAEYGFSESEIAALAEEGAVLAPVALEAAQ